MLPEGERLATLEAHVEELRGDVRELIASEQRSRRRLHNLEGFAQAYLDVQKENRRKEADQYRLLGTRIALAGVLVSAGLLILALVTFLYHK